MKFTHMLLLSLSAVSLIAAAEAQNKSSLSAEFIAEIEQDLPSALAKQVETDLGVMSTFLGQKSSPLNQQIYGSTHLSGKDYFSFFNKRVTGFGQDYCGGPPAGACAYSGGSTMYISPYAATIDNPQMERISIMLHESRHTESENGGWPHVTCPTPFKDKKGIDIRGHDSHILLEGFLGCDNELFGAYGIQTVFLRNVADYCENCTDKIKMDARIYADSFALRIIDPEALKRLLADH